MKQRHRRVADLMSTALLVMREGDTVFQAELEMRVASVRHVPVVDERRHLLGIVSDRDLMRFSGQSTAEDTPLGEVMSRRVITVTPDTLAHEAAEVLLVHKFGALPVVAENGELVGIVTETDFLRVARKALGGDDQD